jgi:hypothetical protein
MNLLCSPLFGNAVLRVSLLIRLAQAAFFAALAPMLLVWWRRLVASGQKNIDM